MVTVVRTPGTLGAVTADIGTLPGLPAGHQGYALQKADDLPLEVLPTNNHAPVFTSAEFFAVDENETTVGMVVATDEDASDEVSYAITGGADMDQFQIDATTDVLSFTDRTQLRGSCRRRSQQRIRRDRHRHQRHGCPRADGRTDDHRDRE